MSKQKSSGLQKPEIEMLPVEALIPYARNARTHSDEQVAQVAASIREFGFTNPVLVSAENDIIAGHGRVMAARKLGLEKVPCIRLAHLTETQRRAYVLADNKLALNAGWDEEFLKLELSFLQDNTDFNLDSIGFSNEELSALLHSEEPSQLSSTNGEERKTLAARFGVAPFSVLNAREGEWQKRKQEWIAMGLKSELGREKNLLCFSAAVQAIQNGKKPYEKNDECINAATVDSNCSGTSIFCPTLTELLVRWFSPKGGTILDPFAGGSVRGIVSGKLGRQYIGVELRKEQVDANRQQADVIFSDATVFESSEKKLISIPVWYCGDSAEIDKICHDVQADMVLSCPPYANLEIYSDDPRDISNKNYLEFLRIYREIIKKTCSLLKPDSFVAWVISEVRDKRGNYYNFVSDTVQAFKDAGLNFYNEAIFVSPVGSLRIRAGRHFLASRKLGKTHQNVLVFVKGDGKKAASRCGDCEDAVNLTFEDNGEEEQADQLQ